MLYKLLLGNIKMKTANINIRVDEQEKKHAELIFKNIGISTSTAINMFLHSVCQKGGIPFELKADTPNIETVKAIKNTMLKQNGNTFKNVNDLMKDLED